jgi:hypothetical protein
MSRTLIAAYLSKCADVYTGMDILARAQFWEGAAGYQPFHKIRGLQSPSALLGLIRDLMGEVSSELPELPDMDVWYANGNTGLYRMALKIAEAIVSKKGLEGADILQEDMARTDPLGSVFFSAGKQVMRSPAHADLVLTGKYFPSDAQVLARRFVARHAIDALREIQRHESLLNKKQDLIVQNTTQDLNPDEWRMVIDRLLGDPEHPLSKEFFVWVRDYASKLGNSVRDDNPVLVAYIDNILNDEGKTSQQIAAEFGVAPSTLTFEKNKFFAHLADVLAHPAAKRVPAILNILSDLDFLTNLQRGTVRGDKVGSEDEALRKSVIRLAHINPKLRAHLLPLLSNR